MSIISKDFSIRFFDCDATAHLKISRLCEFFQETALTNINEQGYDYQKMIKTDNLAVFISRIRIRISHFPVFGEKISISTWLKNYNPEKVAWCDYDVRDAQGNSIIQATSSWLLVDLTNGEAIPFSAGPYNFEMYPDRQALPEVIDLLNPEGMPQTILTKNVRYSDVDLNNHVNNCRYADWVLDAIEPEELKERRIRSIQLNYMLQVPFNSKISLMRFPASERHHITVFGVNEEHPEQVHFQARVGFNKPLH